MEVSQEVELRSIKVKDNHLQQLCGSKAQKQTKG